MTSSKKTHEIFKSELVSIYEVKFQKDNLEFKGLNNSLPANNDILLQFPNTIKT